MLRRRQSFQCTGLWLYPTANVNVVCVHELFSCSGFRHERRTVVEDE